MDVTQCRMARAALGWSWDELARAAGVGRRTVARFERGEAVSPGTVETLRKALEAGGCRFLMSGQFKGAVVPPAQKPIEDQSGGNPLMPRRVSIAATDVAPNGTRGDG